MVKEILNLDGPFLTHNQIEFFWSWTRRKA